MDKEELTPRKHMAKKSYKHIKEDAMVEYVKFCRSVLEGDILYNMNTANRWGEYFMVAAKMVAVNDNVDSHLLLLLGLDKVQDKLIPNGKRVDITPQKAMFVPFLRVIGHCKFNLIPDIDGIVINKGLLVVSKNMDLHRFSKEHSYPKRHKYDEDGNPIVKSTSNK